MLSQRVYFHFDIATVIPLPGFKLFAPSQQTAIKPSRTFNLEFFKAAFSNTVLL